MAEKNRVYIQEAKEAPDDAIIRRGDRGRLYYRTDERGQNHEVGGDHSNELLEDGIEVKQMDHELTEGDVFYDQVNETEAMIVEIDDDTVTVSSGSAQWQETAQDVRTNVDNGEWVYLPDEQRSLDDVEKDEDPCWENYEMVGTKVVNGEEVPDCVPNEDAQTERSDSSCSWKQDEDPCWDGYEMVGTKVDENGNEVPNCVPEEKAEKARRVTEKDVDLIGKPFEGPQGQGPFDDFNDCVRHMDDDMEDAEGWCAWAHHEDTGEWPAEKDLREKVYVSSADEAPKGATVDVDENGLFYRQQAYELGRTTYPEELEEEYEVEMPESDDPGDGVGSEEDEDDEREDLRDSINEAYGKSSKSRVYVDSPSEAPDDADVQEGDRGGYYYETGSAGAGGSDDSEMEPFRQDMADEVDEAIDEFGGAPIDGEEVVNDVINQIPYPSDATEAELEDAVRSAGVIDELVPEVVDVFQEEIDYEGYEDRYDIL